MPTARPTATPTATPTPVIALAGAAYGFEQVAATNMPVYFNTFRVPPTGTKTRLDVFQEPVPNKDPVARMTLREVFDEVTVDGSGSHDPDGSIAEYLWDFGDGAVETAVTARHTFTQPGDYLVVLAITDDGGHMDFVSAEHLVHVGGNVVP